MKRRMNLINSVIIVLTVFAVLLAISLFYHRMSLNSQLTWMRETLRFVSSVTSTDTNAQIDVLRELNTQYRTIRVSLIATDGDVIYDSLVDESRLENHADHEKFQEALRGQIGENTRRSECICQY